MVGVDRLDAGDLIVLSRSGQRLVGTPVGLSRIVDLP
jgi:hypothetical protein